MLHSIFIQYIWICEQCRVFIVFWKLIKIISVLGFLSLYMCISTDDMLLDPDMYEWWNNLLRASLLCIVLPCDGDDDDDKTCIIVTVVKYCSESCLRGLRSDSSGLFRAMCISWPEIWKSHIRFIYLSILCRLSINEQY